MTATRRLNSIAFSMAHKFATSANHFAYMATNGCEQKVVVDLLSGELNPEEYRTERNATLVNMCVANLRRLLEEGYRAPITEAKLEAEFVADAAGQMGPYLKVPGRFKVCIVLPDGRRFIRIYEKEVLAQG